jgi:hypothetical protein
MTGASSASAPEKHAILLAGPRISKPNLLRPARFRWEEIVAIAAERELIGPTPALELRSLWCVPRLNQIL